MTDDVKRVYWDSCVWIGLINEEADRVDNCAALVEEAQKGRFQIWTSSLARAEVVKAKCADEHKTVEQEKDDVISEYFDQDFVFEVALDREIGILARELLRNHNPPLKKPNDAIHLATALIHNIDEFHTYDRDDLLRINGQLTREDGKQITICETPSHRITQPQGSQQSMDLLEREDDDEEASR